MIKSLIFIFAFISINLKVGTKVMHVNNRIEIDTIKKRVPKKAFVHRRYPLRFYKIPKNKRYYNDCVFNSRYNIAQRLGKYPYSKAAKILAVSYEGPRNEDIVKEIKQGNDTVFNYGLHINDSILNYSSLKENKELTSVQINRLTNLIYNNLIKVPNNYADVGYNCFDPRNALLFYDKNGKIFDYIEVCFQCEGYQSESGKINVGTVCNQKYELLRQFFIDLGIKYGTIRKN